MGQFSSKVFCLKAYSFGFTDKKNRRKIPIPEEHCFPRSPHFREQLVEFLEKMFVWQSLLFLGLFGFLLQFEKKCTFYCELSPCWHVPKFTWIQPPINSLPNYSFGHHPTWSCYLKCLLHHPDFNSLLENYKRRICINGNDTLLNMCQLAFDFTCRSLAKILHSLHHRQSTKLNLAINFFFFSQQRTPQHFTQSTTK